MDLQSPEVQADTLESAAYLERLALVSAVHDQAWAVELVGRDLDWSDYPQRLAAAALTSCVLDGEEPDIFKISERINELELAQELNASRGRDVGREASMMLLVAEDRVLTGGEFRSILGRLENLTRARRLSRWAEALAESVNEIPAKAAELGESALGDLANLLAGQARRKTAGSLGDSIREAVERKRAGEDREGYITSPWPELDALTKGYGPKQFVIVCAWPKHGKTSFLLEWARHVSREHGPVYFEQAEMSREEMAERAATRTMETAFEELTEQQLEVLERLSVEDDDLWIDSTGGGLAGFLARVHRWMIMHPDTVAIFVDYIGLLQNHSARINSTQAANEVSDGLKNLSNHFGVPVIAIQQPNRNQLGRVDKRPQVGDLRDSNKLLQDLHKLIFLHRPWKFDPSQPKDLMEGYVLANRNGPEGMVKLRWGAAFFAFDSWEWEPIQGNVPAALPGQIELEEIPFDVV